MGCTVKNSPPSLSGPIRYVFEYLVHQGHRIGVPTAYGKASFYANAKDGFQGRQTSTGIQLTAQSQIGATQAFPLARLWEASPLRLHITRADNSKKVVVFAEDRGPYERRDLSNGKCEYIPHSQRVIDLTYAAALKLDFIRQGDTEVKVQPELGTSWPPRSEKELKVWILRFPAFRTKEGQRIAAQWLAKLQKRDSDAKPKSFHFL